MTVWDEGLRWQPGQDPRGISRWCRAFTGSVECMSAA